MTDGAWCVSVLCVCDCVCLSPFLVPAATTAYNNNKQTVLYKRLLLTLYLYEGNT